MLDDRARQTYGSYTATQRGKSKIGYRDVYVIDLQPESGAMERLFMDAETYLPVRLNSSRM